MSKLSVTLILAITCLVMSTTSVWAQQKEEQIVQTSNAVLNEIMSASASRIPQSMFADAHGVVIIPNLIKGGFVIGARHGNGVLLIRDEQNRWHAPSFVSLTGGNIGFQAGVQSIDLVLVFKTQKSVQNILSGKFTLGVDAAVAAGPVGREAAAGTDTRLKAEIYSYSRSRGVFLGVSLDGSVITVDNFATAAYYRGPGVGQEVVVPPSAAALAQQVAGYSGVESAAVSTSAVADPTVSASAQPGPDIAQTKSEAEAIRDQLAQVAPELYELVDDQWKAYLALPAEIFSGQGHPSKTSLGSSLSHFATVANDPTYKDLSSRPEFHSTYGLLEHYANTLLKPTQGVTLPAPPGAASLELAPTATSTAPGAG
jgi:lipid-binding SYLF domain-containing protein